MLSRDAGKFKGRLLSPYVTFPLYVILRGSGMTIDLLYYDFYVLFTNVYFVYLALYFSARPLSH